MAKIHPTAIVDPRAELGEDVEVCAYAVVKGKVTIGAGTVVLEHTHVHGETAVGRGCRLGPAAWVGMDPQDFKYKGEATRCVIGDGVVVREGASVHRSNKPPEAGHVTKVGDRVYIMAGAHIAHDCRVDNDVVLANGVMLAGHVSVGEKAFLGGGCGVHQFVRVGRLVVIAGNEGTNKDVPPFAAMRYGGLKGYNAVGCRRAGMSRDSVHALRAAYHCIHTNRVVKDAVAEIEATAEMTPEVSELVAFIRGSKRGVLMSTKFIGGGLVGVEDDDE